MTVDIEMLLTGTYVLVDDWYQEQVAPHQPQRPGVAARFSDSEVLCLLLAQDFIPFPSERQFLAFIRAQYLALFPHLLSDSQFNRRARALGHHLEGLRRCWAEQLGVHQQTQFLLDTKPVPVMSWLRAKHHSDFQGSASYGYCPCRQMHYFGYKLVLLVDLNGVPVALELVPAHTDERQAAEEVLDAIFHCDVFGDKGFIGQHWQQDQLQWQGNRIWTQKRRNQKQQNPPAFDRLLKSVRQRIEGIFNEFQNTGRNLERLLAKTVSGLCTRVLAKVTNYTLKLLLRRHFGIDAQTFSIVEL